MHAIRKARRFLTMSAVIALAIGSSTGLAQPVAAGQEADAPAEQADRRPDVIVFMLDDVGFAQLSSFGGLVATPNMDRVASRGVRYTNYRTTPICSASRAALLMGRNPHSVHIGGHSGAPMPYPGYDGLIPASAGTIAANLRAAGYTTIALGKWDHLPSEDMTQAGPFTYWPTGQGFDKFYGFIGADADNWRPVLVDGTSPVNTPATPDYHLNNDLADRAIAAFNARSSRIGANPIFMYLATGTAHAPHHAPQSWIDHYSGQFDMGWDRAREIVLEQQIAQGIMPEGTVLAPRPEGMPAWDTLSAGEQRLYARQMEVFAAALSHADEQFGRILDTLEANGELDNTIIVITSDNGASAEGAFDGTHNETLFMNGHFATAEENMEFIDQWGGPETQPHYSFGWAVAGNTPLRYFKQTTHEGGIRVPLIISWPGSGAGQGELRDSFAYVADVMPTILDLADVSLAPVINNVTQVPMEGVSLEAGFLAADAVPASRAQYFTMYGNRGLWMDGWSIVTSHRLNPWLMNQTHPITETWELYHTEEDPGQTVNLASTYPEKLAELVAVFEEQARLYNLNPISNFGDSIAFQRDAFVAEFSARNGLWLYNGPMSNTAGGAAPPLSNRPYEMKARIDLTTGQETGPIFAFGGSSGGMAAYLADGVPAFAFRDLSGGLTVLEASAPLPPGSSELTIRLDRPAPRPMADEAVTVTISVGDQVLVSQTINTVLPASYGVAETFDIGVDRGTTVSPAYAPDQPFQGQLGSVAFQFR